MSHNEATSWPTVAMVIGMSLIISVSASAQPGTTVVVAPFTNLSQQTTDDWISAGIVETVSSDLQQAGLTVMGRRGAMLTGWSTVAFSGLATSFA